MTWWDLRVHTTKAFQFLQQSGSIWGPCQNVALTLVNTHNLLEWMMSLEPGTAPAAHYPGDLCLFMARAIVNTWQQHSFASRGSSLQAKSTTQVDPTLLKDIF